MNTFSILVLICAFLALEVQCAPQIKLEIGGVTENAWVNNVLGNAANTIDAITGNTTPSSIPQRIQAAVQGAAASLSNSIRNAPATIQNVFQSASQSIGSLLGLRTTTPSSLLSISLG